MWAASHPPCAERLRRSLAAAALSAALAMAGCGGSSDARDPDEPAPRGLGLEEVGKFDEPVFLAQPHGEDQPLYVVERGGRIVAGGEGSEEATEPLLDIRRDVLAEGEAGMFSAAFAPDFERSGLLYVDYAGRDGRIHVDEFRARAGVADPASRREVLSIPHPEAMHWGGLVLFGPDDLLYVSVGDGGPVAPIPPTAQDPRSLLGKLLRIDPRERGGRAYSIPPGNPFAEGGGAPEVFALGLRNPWRFSFDRATGDLWIGDVGDFTQEEVDHVPSEDTAGANLGWPALEGTAPTARITLSDPKPPPPDAIPPVLTYERTGKPGDADCAVTGGYVVRDPQLPSLDGRYLYGDFCRGQIRSLALPDGEPREDRKTGLEVPRLASFAEDGAGRLYAVSLSGEVFRLVEG
jgi:glucose/arabinose dehydrogenase